MSTETLSPPPAPAVDDFPYPPSGMPDSDDAIMETPLHRANMNLLIEVTHVSRAGRRDYYVGGNMFVYFSAAQVRNRDYSGPDYYFVNGVDLSRDRPYWAIWDEGGRYPTVIVELTSPSTADVDWTTKKDLYEQTFRTPEYFIHDPVSGELDGWRLTNSHYVKIEPDARDWLWSEQLGVWLGPWQGAYLKLVGPFVRFFDADGNMVLTGEERAATAETEIEQLRRELAELRRQTPQGGQS